MTSLDRARVRDLLQNWRYYSRDYPRDSAEIYYYTVSPAFRQYVKPTPKFVRYDEESADMVEDVMRELYKWQPKAREMLILYWMYIPNNEGLAEALGTSKRTVERRMAEAHEAFAKHWAMLFFDG